MSAAEPGRAPVRVLIVDDHSIVREGLAMLLAEDPEVEVVGEAADGETALVRVAELAPEVVLLDLMMPGMGGLATLRRLRTGKAADEGPRVVVLTSFAEGEQVTEAIAAGAMGYLLKDVARDELVRAVVAAAAGQPTLHPEAQRRLVERLSAPRPRSPLDELTPRERDVLGQIARGRSNKQIAATLYLSEGTVKGYVSSVLAKLGVDDRAQAALWAARQGLGGEPDDSL
jgi:NarL family two-component system response regulator LiaR